MTNHKINLYKSKIFVPGATGFLGTRLVNRLKKEKLNFVTASKTLGTDFRNQKEVDDFFTREKPDIVINCAAYVGGIKFSLEHEGEIFFNNILISTYLIEAARKYGVKRFVNPISNCSYPNVVQKDFKEKEWWDGPLHPSVFVYGFIRKAVWTQTYAYHRQYNMNFTNFLIPNMYGPNDHFNEIRSHALGALIMKIFRAKKENLPSVIVWGSGKPIREWLYVDDAVEAFMRSFSIEPHVDPINLGQGKGISIAELANKIKKVVDYKGKLVFDTKKPDGAPYKVMNVEKLKKMYKWLPSTSLDSGIKKTIDWYNQSMAKSSYK